jgi:hypothetical protein
LSLYLKSGTNIFIIANMNGRQIVFLIIAGLIATVFILPACKKTVSNRKLNGDWEVSSISGTTTYTLPMGVVFSRQALEFDGTREIRTSTHYFPSGPYTQSDTTEKRIRYTFEKKTGIYKKVEETPVSFRREFYYYSKNNKGEYIAQGKLDGRTTVSITRFTEGIYSLAGGTGEIEKNSQIVLCQTLTAKKEHYVSVYYLPGTSTEFTDLEGKYEAKAGPSGTSFIALSKGNRIDSTYKAVKESNCGILNVVSLKKGIMKIHQQESSSVSENNVQGVKSESDFYWTLTRIRE